jgi:hypothetical protein
MNKNRTKPSNKNKITDLGMTIEQAIRRNDFHQCYQLLGKYYTADTFHTAPPVLLGQCLSCGEMTWDESNDEDFGKCSKCGFSG